MVTSSRSSLDVRKAPVQARSQQRVLQILAATRTLLREQGLAAVTTTAIAEQAGIPVGSLYQYYPNKKAILMALYEDYLAKVRQIFVEFQDTHHIEAGWKACLTQLFESVHQAEGRDQIDNELEKALRIYPELAEVDRQHREQIAGLQVTLLRKLGSRWSKAKLRRMALYTYAMSSGSWEYRAEVRPRRRELMDWNMTVTMAILSKCFD